MVGGGLLPICHCVHHVVMFCGSGICAGEGGHVSAHAEEGAELSRGPPEALLVASEPVTAVLYLLSVFSRVQHFCHHAIYAFLRASQIYLLSSLCPLRGGLSRSSLFVGRRGPEALLVADDQTACRRG